MQMVQKLSASKQCLRKVTKQSRYYLYCITGDTDLGDRVKNSAYVLSTVVVDPKTLKAINIQKRVTEGVM